MKQEQTYDCVYGSGHTEAEVHVYEGWYVVDGGTMANYAPNQKFYDGIDVELIEDIDCFTWNKPILSLEELIEAVEA